MLPPGAHVLATLTPSLHGELLPQLLVGPSHRDLVDMGPSEAEHIRGTQGGALKTLENDRPQKADQFSAQLLTALLATPC
jgi:hypothetical protein